MKTDGKDVGFIDDAMCLIQNMCCAEHHAAQCFSETKEDKWIEILTTIRRDRSVILDQITPKDSSQLYCFNKHTLTFVQNYKELANRFLELGDQETAKEFIDIASKYESLIRYLNIEKGGKKSVLQKTNNSSA